MNKANTLPEAYGLLSSLNFDLTMDPAIQTALESNGISGLTASAFPGLEIWRKSVADFGALVAASISSYDPFVTIYDEFISLPNAVHTLRLRIYRPSNNKELLPGFYWMHGGGLMGGTPEQDDIQMKEIVVKAGCVVVSVDYRVAPENKFPIPLDDCYAGLMWLKAHSDELGIDNNKIAIGGASAGGGLAAALAQKVRKSGDLKIVHQSLTYPMLDDKNLTKSSFQITNLGVWDRLFNLIGWQAYLGTDQGKPTIPEFAAASREQRLAELPPAFIAVGALDLFRDEDIEYALRLMEAGVATALHFYPGAVHGFDWHVPDAPMTHSLLATRINALQLAFA